MPSCEKARQILWAEWLCEEVLAKVAHRHVVLTIPRLLVEPRAQAIRDAVPGVERVVAKIEMEAWKVLSPVGRAKPRVLGVSSDYPALVKLWLHKGRFFDRADEDTHAAVCVIGDQVRRDLFGFERALGRPLKVNDQWLTVVGVLEGGGGKREIQGVTLEGTANDVYLPVTAAERRFGRAAPLCRLVEQHPEELLRVWPTRFARQHGRNLSRTWRGAEVAAISDQQRRKTLAAPNTWA